MMSRLVHYDSQMKASQPGVVLGSRVRIQFEEASHALNILFRAHIHTATFLGITVFIPPLIFCYFQAWKNDLVARTVRWGRVKGECEKEKEPTAVAHI